MSRTLNLKADPQKLQFMTVTNHEIVLKVESKSKARILGKQIKSYLVGHRFETLFRVINVGSVNFPGGRFIVSIRWPNGQTVEETIQIPALGPGEAHKTPPFATDALSRGFGLFTLESRPANDGKPVNFCKVSREPIQSGSPGTVPSFHSILAKEPEEIYEFWGMIIAAGSLTFLVVIELIRFAIWLGTLAN